MLHSSGTFVPRLSLLQPCASVPDISDAPVTYRTHCICRNIPHLSKRRFWLPLGIENSLERLLSGAEVWLNLELAQSVAARDLVG